MRIVFRLIAMHIMLMMFFFGVTQPPRVNSFINAKSTIFLDFDGQHIAGTSWNWDGAINASGSGLSNSAIVEVFNRVAEDYRPFNLNITTDSNAYFAAPYNKRLRVIVTPTYEWYGKIAGGVSYVGSFTWGNETPAWVFSGQLSYNTKYVAEACSHEIGHTLGLQHQSIYDANCNKLSEYDEGQGEGETGWAPIMGLSYYKNLTTWTSGPSTEGCNNIQNDLAIIAGPTNNFGFRDDDHGNDLNTATNIKMNGLTFSVTGLVNTPGDVDAFRLRVTLPTNFKLNAFPQNVGWGNAGADVDIEITLKNASSKTIGVYNPVMLLNAGVDTSLLPGDYFILVKGTGNVNHSSYGSLGHYNLAASLAVALPVNLFTLNVRALNGNHYLNWSFMTDEPIKAVVPEILRDGINFRELAILEANVRTFIYKPVDNSYYYRLKAITEREGKSFYSAVSKVDEPQQNKTVKLLSNICYQSFNCISQGLHNYELFDVGGKLIKKGTLVNGMNNINISGAANGIIILRLSNSGTAWTERLIKQ